MDTLAYILLYAALLLAALVVAVVASAYLRQPKHIGVLILFAWAVRITLMGLLKLHSYSSGLEGFYPGDADAHFYHDWAAIHSQQDGWFSSLLGMPPYLLITTAVYRYAGANMNLPQLVNLGLSVLGVPLIFEIGRRVSGSRAGAGAALLWGLLPSGVFWSVSLSKDIWIVVGVLLTCYFALGISRDVAVKRRYLAGAVGLLLLAWFRPPYIIVPILAMGLFYLFRKRSTGRGRVKGLVLWAAAAAAVGATAMGGAIFSAILAAVSVEGAQDAAEVALAGGSGVAFLLRFPPAVRWIVQFPFTVFAPFPWQWLTTGSGFGRLAAIEMFVWYLLYYRIWKARRLILGSNEGRMVLLFAFAVFLAVSFSLPNLGSIYRYRWPALVLLSTVAFTPTGARNRKRRPHTSRETTHAPPDGLAASW